MRLTQSLLFHLEPAKPGTTLRLIAPVDQAGRSRICRPLSRKKRLVDLGPGDHVLYRGRVFRIQRVEPLRGDALPDEIFRKRRGFENGVVPAGDPS